MNCSKCGKPLPSEGITCRFCGTLMNQQQINYQKKMKDRNNQNITLLSEKYGKENKIEYNPKKENKLLGGIIITVILLILIILTILINT